MSNGKQAASKQLDPIDRPQWIAAVAGMLSGATTALFTAPLDLIRTQHMAVREARSGIISARKIVNREGFFGLYRGLGLTMMGLMPTWAIYWFTYSSLKSGAVHQLGFNEDSASTHLIAAMGAGVTTTISTNPVWVVKTRLQTQKLKFNLANPQYSSIPHAIATIWKLEGTRGFFKGVVPSLLGVGHVCVQFPLYEHIKLMFADHGNKTTQDLTLTELIIASMISKVVASCAAFPHEVLRVRQQIEHKSETDLIGLARETYLQEGFKGFYRGIWVNLLRVVPACAITFVTFEYVSKGLTNWTTKKPEQSSSV